MNDNQIAKIQRFLSDKVMSEAVWDVMLGSFIKPKSSADVYEKAARFIAIENLHEAWRELSKYQIEEDKLSTKGVQVGL